MGYTLVSSDDNSALDPPKSTSKSRLRFFFLLTLICGASFFVFSTNYYYKNEVLVIYHQNVSKHYTLGMSPDIFAIKTEGCTIPALNPMDETVKRFIRRPKVLACPNSNFPLISSNGTHLTINKHPKTLAHYKILKNNPNCCYIPFVRPKYIEDINEMTVDDRVTYDECKDFKDTIELEDEFVFVKCTYEERVVYQQFFITAPKKEIQNELYDSTVEIPQNKSAYNVIILGIDNLSRLNFYRTMPKTLNYLLANGAIELMGYSKVGDNSYPNLSAFLFGRDVKEIEEMCHPFSHNFFDECPFVWYKFKKVGYYTAFGEDSSYLGTFNYLMDGFVRQPTDYYIHPFIAEAHKVVGTRTILNAQLCMGDKYFYKVLLDYVEDLTVTMSESKLFAFFWESTMSHDYLNYPKIMDDDYLKFLERVKARGYFNNTVFIVMSDHGIRWGPIRSTTQGKLEEQLPFMYILTPPSFQQLYKSAYNNLKINRRRLITPFDMHETLVDLIDLKSLSDDTIAFREKNTSYAVNRGISLFLPVPTNRTCKTAAIADHWCACHSRKDIPTQDPKVIEAADYLVANINNFTRKHSQCALLSKVDLLRAAEIIPTKTDAEEEEERDWIEYLVAVKTDPGGAIFEGTLLRTPTGNWSLRGQASRLNLYRNQSWCVDDAVMKLYCYCVN